MKLLNNQQTAFLLGLKPSTLEIWRVLGKGPSFHKIGRLVRYSEDEVLQWLKLQVRRSTSTSARSF